MRSTQLPVEVAARVQAQEAAGRLVFDLEQTAPAPSVVIKSAPVPSAELTTEETKTDTGEGGSYALRPERSAPTVLR